MRIGQRIRLTTSTAPQGNDMSSLADLHTNRVPGTIQQREEPEGWYLVQFDTLPNGDRLNVHVSMMTPYR